MSKSPTPTWSPRLPTCLPTVLPALSTSLTIDFKAAPPPSPLSGFDFGRTLDRDLDATLERSASPPATLATVAVPINAGVFAF
jgi:hypothetical protein